MKNGSANAKAATRVARKQSLSFEFVIQKPYATKRHTDMTQFYADLTQCCDPVRHEAFTACLIDRGPSPIRDNNFEALLAGRKRQRAQLDRRQLRRRQFLMAPGVSSPSQQNHFRAEPRTHCQENTICPGRWQWFIRTSSRTRRTEAEERFPNRFKQSHD